MSDEPAADLQSAWHEYVGGRVYSHASILDVGAGQGKSKARMSQRGNVVTTQDINRNLMLCVDIVKPICQISNLMLSRFDVVTAFDVIEHVPDPEEFLYDVRKLSTHEAFITTPNKKFYPAPWHYTIDDMLLLIAALPTKQKFFYGRNRIATGDEIFETPLEKMDAVQYFGFRLIWR